MDNFTRDILVLVTDVAAGTRSTDEFRSEAVNLMASIYEKELVKESKPEHKYDTALNGLLELYLHTFPVTVNPSYPLTRSNCRIPLIKAVRCITGWGLKEAKDWVDKRIPDTKKWVQ
jgi:hypothetical protein